jgi:hypothetical protein
VTDSAEDRDEFFIAHRHGHPGPADELDGAALGAAR